MSCARDRAAPGANEALASHREVLRERVGATVADGEAVEEELRDLFHGLSG